MLSILVAAIALFIFAALWFTVLFGKTWARLMNFSPEEMKSGQGKSMTQPLIMNFVLNLITAGSIYYFFPILFISSYTELITTMLIVWFGFSFVIYANSALWEKKSWKLVILNSVYGILSIVIVSTIIYYMQ